jgi:3-oxoacyl-[acyl-carrier-protein] synthase III
MRTIIKDIAYFLPEQIITNEHLHRENPDWDMDLVTTRTGVKQRHLAESGETALDLSVKACQKLLSNHNEASGQIDGIIFCTQSPDYIMPPNSSLLHKILGLSENVFAFDINLACSGYVFGLALANGLIQTGVATNILFVTADTYSKYIHKKDRSARALFGDGSSVSWITASDSSQGIIDLQCSTSGKDYDKFMIPAGAQRMPLSYETSLEKSDESGNVRSLANIHMDGMGVLTFVNSKVPKQILKLLERNQLQIEDIDLFIFHQASKLALDSLTRLLKIKPVRVFQNLSKVGNTVSSSIPIALKDALESGRVNEGDKVILSGFGVGLSWASALIEI